MGTRHRARKTATRYAIYLRCSTDDQAQKDFTTIDAQREINRKHVEALGGQIVKEYADEGKTGTNINRPAFRQMPDDAANGDFDAVCVTYMSRLGLGDAFIIAQYELGKHGVTVELVKEKFTDDLAGYMGKTMTTMMDGVYPKMVSQWTRTKMERMVKRGYHCGGLTPFGYMTEIVADATLWPDADESEREEIMKALVYRVELTEKKRVTVELETLSLMSHAQIFELNSKLGAGVGLEPTTFGL